MNRRQILQLIGFAATATTCRLGFAVTNQKEAQRDRIVGLLIGSLIGDAAGGPVEFKSNEVRKEWLPDARSWPDSERLDERKIQKLSEDFPLLPYKGIRPEAVGYGPWATDAPAGTITDDSRLKILLIHVLSKLRGNRQSLTQKDLAQGFLDFRSSKGVVNNAGYDELYDESFVEFNYAAHWILGERNLDIARPVSRLWGGLGTCCGQMCLPPLAAIYPGDPEQAYRAAYAIGFCDQGVGKDMNAALIAGLATAINDNTASTNKRWENTLRTIRNTDPFRFQDIRFVGRELNKWLDFAKNAATRADRKPKKLFEILEKEGRPVFWWESHFIIACAFSMLHLCDFQPLAAMHLALDFGHDTDSVAQVIGGFAGAVLGADVFPKSFRETVKARLRDEYFEDIDTWVDLLIELSDRSKYPKPIQFD